MVLQLAWMRIVCGTSWQSINLNWQPVTTNMTYVPIDIQRALQDAHISTWFMIEGEKQICITDRGSRPGSPLADLAFNALISHLILEVQHSIDALPQMQLAHSKLGVTTPIFGWVDDLAVPTVATRAHEMTSLLEQVTHIVYHACQKRGLTLNFKPGKTEAICCFKGQGSADLKRALFIDNLGHLPLTDPSVNLRIVGSYEHLGTRCIQSGNISHEVATRIGKASSAYHAVSKSILLNRRISPLARLRLLEALVIPVLLHGSGNWPLLNRRTFVRLQRVLTTWIRSIVNDGHWNEHQSNDNDLFAHWRVLDLKGRLNKGRLLYGFQLLRNAPSPLIDFVTAVDLADNQEWLAATREAIQWVSVLDETLRIGVSQKMTTEQVFQWFSDHAHHGPARVRRCADRHVQLEHQMLQVRLLHQELCDIAKAKGVVFPDTLPPDTGSPLDFPCPDCHATFRHPQHLAAHRWRQHGSFSDERRLCFDAVCRACQTCFWTIQRLQQHLKASRREPDGCYCQLTWWCKPLSQLCHVDKPEEVKMVHRLPACSTVMSLDHPERISSYDEALQVFANEWTRLDLPDTLTEVDRIARFSTINSFMQMLGSYARDDGQTSLVPLLLALQETSLQGNSEELPIWALSLWIKTCLSPATTPMLDAQAFSLMREDLWALVQEFPIGRLLLWKWRMEEAHIPESQSVSRTGDLTQPELSRSTYLCQTDMITSIIGISPPCMPACQGVPIVHIDGQPCILLLHLFSGRRRVGDCHDWVAELAPRLLPDYQVIILSMDTAIHPELGNLDDGPALSIAKRVTLDGVISGTLTGPPCETWSAARYVPAPPGHESSWPRLIRDRSCPWGKPTNTPREGRQVAMGTKLLLHSWQLELGTVLNGGGSIKEHPAQPDDAEKASTWATPTHDRMMMHLPDAHLHQVQQWRYGSHAIKPTCLRTINLGSAEQTARVLRDAEMIGPTKPVVSLQGKDATGAFRTCAAKEYPRRFCNAIVATMLCGLQHRMRTEGIRICTERLQPEMVTWIEDLRGAAAFIHRSQFLPDYQGCWMTFLPPKLVEFKHGVRDSLITRNEMNEVLQIKSFLPILKLQHLQKQYDKF